MKDFAILINGRAYKQQELLNSGKYRVLRVGNFFSNESWYYSNLELNENQYCNKGDLLYAWSCTYGAYLWDRSKTIYHYHIWKVAFKNVNKKFLYYLLNNDVEKQRKASQGSTMSHITKGYMEMHFFSLPISLNEQHRIASALSDIDTLLSALNKKITKKKLIKQGAMQQLLTGKKRLAGFTEPWVEKELREILSIGNGRDYKHLRSGLIPVFGTGGILCYVNNWLYDGETVCIGRKGTINEPIYYKGKIWTVDTLFYTHIFKDSCPKFIYYLFQAIDWLKYNEATGVPSLSKINIYQIQVTIPTLAEQTAIATILSDMDKEIEQLEAKRAKYEQVKQGMMQLLLTGKIRLID